MLKICEYVHLSMQEIGVTNMHPYTYKHVFQQVAYSVEHDSMYSV